MHQYRHYLFALSLLRPMRDPSVFVTLIRQVNVAAWSSQPVEAVVGVRSSRRSSSLSVNMLALVGDGQSRKVDQSMGICIATC